MGENDKGGIYSLAGFAYQIKVFILQLVKLKEGYTLEYETIDDVALKIDSEKLDEYDDQLYSIFKTSKKRAIQVKKTQVTKDIAKKVVKNWIIADKNNCGIEEFLLITDRDVVDDIFCGINADEICMEVATAKGKKSIDAKVKSLGYSKDELKEKVKDILQKSFVHRYMDIDGKIMDEYSDYFIKSAVTSLTYILRIKQLMEQITVEILDAVMKGKAYELTYDKMCFMKNRIISEITDEKWQPSFAKFRRLRRVNLSDLAVIKSREYLQLIECCKLTNEDIKRHLQYGEYYANSKRAYFERGMADMVDDIECTAYDNFCDVKIELRNKSADTPDNRLIEIKMKSNSKAVDEQIKYGVCINLTSEDTDKCMQISWKDD